MPLAALLFSLSLLSPFVRAELQPSSAVDCYSLSSAPALRRVLAKQFCGGKQEIWDASRCSQVAERRGFGREFPHIILAADLARAIQGGPSDGINEKIHGYMVDLAVERLVQGIEEPAGCRSAARGSGFVARSNRPEPVESKPVSVVSDAHIKRQENAATLIRRAALLQLLAYAPERKEDRKDIEALITQTMLRHRTLRTGSCEWWSGLRRFDPILGPPSEPCGPAPVMSGPFGLLPVLPATPQALPWNEAYLLRDHKRAGSLAARIAQGATGYAKYCYRSVKAAMISVGLLPGVAEASQTGAIGIDPGDAYKLAEALSEKADSPERLDLTGLRSVAPRSIPWTQLTPQAAADLDGMIVVYDRSEECDLKFSRESGHVEIITSCSTGACPAGGFAATAWAKPESGLLVCSDGCSKRTFQSFSEAANRKEGCLSLYMPVRPIQAIAP